MASFLQEELYSITFLVVAFSEDAVEAFLWTPTLQNSPFTGWRKIAEQQRFILCSWTIHIQAYAFQLRFHHPTLALTVFAMGKNKQIHVHVDSFLTPQGSEQASHIVSCRSIRYFIPYGHRYDGRVTLVLLPSATSKQLFVFLIF